MLRDGLSLLIDGKQIANAMERFNLKVELPLGPTRASSIDRNE